MGLYSGSTKWDRYHFDRRTKLIAVKSYVPDVTPLPSCLEYFVTDDGFYLVTEDGNYIVTEKDPCCFDYIVDEYGNDLVTEDGNYIVYDNGTCTLLVLDAYYNPGSVIVDYVLSSNSQVLDDISISFTNTLGVITGNPINVESQVTLLSGSTTGVTQVILQDDFSNLNGSSLFTETTITQSGGTYSYNITNNPIFPSPTPSITPSPTPTPTPTPVTNYWEITNCGGGFNIIVDFGDYSPNQGETYNLTFVGYSPPNNWNCWQVVGTGVGSPYTLQTINSGPWLGCKGCPL
jgi:hypothetical protein